MNRLILVIIINTAFLFGVSGETRKTREQAIMTNVLRAVQKYVELERRDPQSWGDLRNSDSSSWLFDIIQKHDRDFLGKVRFLSEEVRLDYAPNFGDVVLMSCNPLDFGGEEKRLMLFKHSNGGYSVITISEESLKSLLIKQGYSLSDYTGNNGHWVTENPLSNLDKNFPDENGTRENDEGLTSDGLPKSIVSSKDGIHLKGDLPKQKFSWFSFFLLFSLLISLGVFYVRRREFKERKKK